MKKFLLSALAATTLLTSSCSEDFDVAAPYKNVTFVYAMLNQADTAQYIRIQKAFMDQDKSSLDMSKIADSSFYADGVLDVVVKEIQNGSVISTTPLTRVRMENEGYPKQDGQFFTGPNYAYKYIPPGPGNRLNKNYLYRLEIKNTQTGEEYSAETNIIPTDTNRGNFYIYAFGDPTINYAPDPLTFTKTVPAASMRYELIVSVPSPARTLEGTIRFFYWEKNNTLQTEEQKYVDFPFAQTLVNSGNGTLSVPNSAFYYFFRDNLGPAPANTVRYLDSCDIYVYAGSQALEDYRALNGAQGGITSNEIKPIYTNMKGNNVYGLFTTRGVRIGRNLAINGATLDSLYTNPITAGVGIADQPSDK
ncbi:MAG: hypothetical protein JNL72_11730 [Flavipsychrobacter sp.]|nr:hypothetical protein [Flavipsychrobacter sp.]